MTAPHAHSIIAGYMSRLSETLSALPRRHREEITAEIEEHIREARAGLAEEADADVLSILDRLGDPDDIAHDARRRFGVEQRGPGLLEIAALLLIGLSGLVLHNGWPLGWVAGLVLVALSPCWTSRDKRWGAYLPAALGLALAGAAAVLVPLGLTTLYVGASAFHIAFGLSSLGFVLLPLASAVYLARRLRLIGASWRWWPIV